MSMATNIDAHDALLLDYAAGTLDGAHALVIAAYLTLSPEARRVVSACETLGGALIEEMCDCAALSENCLEKLMAEIDAIEQTSPCAAACCGTSCVETTAPLPQPVMELLPAGMTPRWKRAMGGVVWIDIPVEGSARPVTLMRYSPGFVMPYHTHRDTEITLILEGALEDEHGRYVRGDLVIMDPGTGHEPIADREDGCLCFTLTLRPVRFDGIVLRWINPFR